MRTWSRRAAVALVASVALGVSGCGLLGSATVNVVQAEQELSTLMTQTVDLLGLEVTETQPFSAHRACTRLNGQEGAFTASAVSGVVTDGSFRADTVAGLLLDAGFELQRSDRTVEVFGRRDGMWLTATFEPRRGTVVVDVNTGCRAQ